MRKRGAGLAEVAQEETEEEEEEGQKAECEGAEVGKWLMGEGICPRLDSKKPYIDVYCRILHAYTIIYANIHQRVLF